MGLQVGGQPAPRAGRWLEGQSGEPSRCGPGEDLVLKN